MAFRWTRDNFRWQRQPDPMEKIKMLEAQLSNTLEPLTNQPGIPSRSFEGLQTAAGTPFEVDTFDDTEMMMADLNQLKQQGLKNIWDEMPVKGLLSRRQNEAFSALLANPVTRPFGSALLQSMIPQAGENLFAKINPKNYTRESVAQFQRSGDYSALTPVTPEGERDKKISTATQMRSQFNNLSKGFVSARDAFGRVIASVQDPSPMGDLALIFNYMKVLDPGSTVREGEFAQVGRSGNLPTQVQAFFDQYTKGNRLTPEQRNDVFNRAQRLYVAQLKNQESVEKQYRGIAQRSELNPEDVVVDYRSQISIPAPPKGKRVAGMLYTTPNGVFKWTGTGWVKP